MQQGDHVDIAGSSAAGDAARVNHYDPRKYDALSEDDYRDYVQCGMTEDIILNINSNRKKRIDDAIGSFVLSENEPLKPKEEIHVITVVLIGRTGAGKSSVGNTLIGKQVFETGNQDTRVTYSAKVHDFNHGEQRYRVVDTPGLYDPYITNEEGRLMAKGLNECPDGVDVFLYISNATALRYAIEQQQEDTQIEAIFGHTVFDHTTVILTHAETVFGERLDLAGYLEMMPRGEFIRKHMQNRVVAIENKAVTHYERERMRALLFNMIDHQLKHVDGRRYTYKPCQQAHEIPGLITHGRDLDLDYVQKVINKTRHQELGKCKIM